MATATAGMNRKLSTVDAQVSRPRNRIRENAYAAGVPTTSADERRDADHDDGVADEREHAPGCR